MDNMLLQRYVGKVCTISQSALGGGTIRGTILTVVDNWLEVQTARGATLVNADFVSAIKVRG